MAFPRVEIQRADPVGDYWVESGQNVYIAMRLLTHCWSAIFYVLINAWSRLFFKLALWLCKYVPGSAKKIHIDTSAVINLLIYLTVFEYFYSHFVNLVSNRHNGKKTNVTKKLDNIMENLNLQIFLSFDFIFFSFVKLILSLTLHQTTANWITNWSINYATSHLFHLLRSFSQLSNQPVTSLL